MPKYTIVIDTGNASFEDNIPGEVARVLRDMADRMENHEMLPAPRDSNGNKCGSVTVEAE